LPMILATWEEASERMADVLTPSRLTLVEMFKQGIFSVDNTLVLFATSLHIYTSAQLSCLHWMYYFLKYFLFRNI
jgi:hypothetical protein